MAKLVAILFVFLLSACTSQPRTYYSTAPDIPCTPIEAQITSKNDTVPAGFICPTGGARASLVANACSWVDGYYRKDGVYVAGHTRCRNNIAAANTSSSGSSTSDAPCVTGSCGPVNVRGYYRKDGTYVRPHTRSRGRR